jgi:adenylosuccinate lyase
MIGAVGTLAAPGDHGIAVQEALFAELGLGTPKIALHVARDRISELPVPAKRHVAVRSGRDEA